MRFIKGQHYGCEECDYAIQVHSEEELEKHKKIHDSKCNGRFEEATGDCIKKAFILSRKNNWLFCFADIKKKVKDQKRIHAWCEGKGYMEERDGDIFMVIKNLEGKDTDDFVFDFSDNNRVAMRKEDYYKKLNIEEEDVKKFTPEETKKNMNNSKERTGDLYSWISDLA